MGRGSRTKYFGILSRKAVLAALLATTAIATTAVVSTSAYAQASAEVSFNIPAGPLNRALAAFGSQSGVQLSYEAAIANGKTSRGISGAATREQALTRLLEGAGLVFQFTDGRNVLIRQPGSAAAGNVSADGSVTLGTLRIQGENAWGPVDGVVATRTGTGSKTDTPIIEIPQTINVVTADEIEARASTSVTEVLRYTPGVNVNGFTDTNKVADEITSRSFSPSPLYIDGGYLPYAGSLGGSPQIDPYWLERVEVLKGPASVLYGQNQPGGIVNMVTKKPLAETLREAKVSIDSNGQKEVGVDLSGPLTVDKSVLYRLTALVKGGNGQIDYTDSSRIFVAPSVTLKPNEQTAFTLYGSYQRDRDTPDYQPLPYIGTVVPGPDGKFIDRDLFTGEPGWNAFSRDQFIIGADLDHVFSDSIKFRSRARYVDVNDDYKGYYLNGFVNLGGGVMDYSRANRTKLNWAQHNTVLSLDNSLEFNYDTGPLNHTIVVGTDYRRFTRKYDGYNTYNAYPLDLYNPSYGVSYPEPPLTTRWDNTLSQVGIYAQDQIKLDRFVVTAGGRYDWASIDNQTLPTTPGGAVTTDKQDDGAFTGRIGVTYLFDNGIAPYASYSQSFLPQLGTTFTGSSFKPLTGEQFEVGVKYQPPGTNTMFTVSAFQITQQNMLTEDYANLGYYLQDGEIRSRGFELEAKGEIMDGWTVVAGVSYTDAEYTKSSWNQDKKSVLHAPWAASLWTSYEFQDGTLEGLNIGAGVRYTGSKFADAANTLETPAFAVVDAALSYELGNLRSELSGTKLTLNVDNLFDTKYVSNCNWAAGCYYGNARTIRAGISGKF